MNVLDNRIPSPLVALLLAGGMWGLARVAPSLGLGFAIRAPLEAYLGEVRRWL